MTQLCFDLQQPQATVAAHPLNRTRKLRGQMAYLSGLAAEDQVVADYLRRGYALAEARWRGKAGEIDLIFRDGAGFVFVEVKKSSSYDRALEALTHRQVDRIMLAGQEYLGFCGAGQLTNMRFDVALVDRHGQIKVLEAALCGW